MTANVGRLGPEIELTVRCAHQTVPDLNVLCQPSWTVRDLKEKLRDLYAHQPDPTRQRLIYAGQLLKDSAHLDEIIRVYSPEQQQVVHFVYTPNVDDIRHDVEVRRRRASPPTATRPVGPSSANIERDTAAPTATTTAMPSETLDANAAFWLQTQQAYAMFLHNYASYLQQIYGPLHFPIGFAQQMGAAATTVPPFVVVGGAQAMPAAPAADNDARPLAAQPQAAPVAEPAMNAQGGVDDDEPRERDWLDWLYVASRFAFLLMILYFYSSVERFLFVMITILLIYGFQAGWFARRGPAPRQHADAPVAPPVVPAEDRRDDAQPQNELLQQAEPPPVAAEQPIPPPQLQPEATAWTVFWSTCYVFITSFFASLVPQRPAPVQVN